MFYFHRKYLEFSNFRDLRNDSAIKSNFPPSDQQRIHRNDSHNSSLGVSQSHASDPTVSCNEINSDVLTVCVKYLLDFQIIANKHISCIGQKNLLLFVLISKNNIFGFHSQPIPNRTSITQRIGLSA